MYSEKSYKNYIFWVQVKRVVLIIILSSIGAGIGILIGKTMESLVQISTYNNTIIVVSTVIFFVLSLLFTAGTGKEVQDGYWRIAVLRKLTVIQRELELNNQLLKKTGIPKNNNLSKVQKDTDFIKKDKNKDNKEENENEDEEENQKDMELIAFEETALVPKEKKKKVHKTLKKPEELQ